MGAFPQWNDEPQDCTVGIGTVGRLQNQSWVTSCNGMMSPRMAPWAWAPWADSRVILKAEVTVFAVQMRREGIKRKLGARLGSLLWRQDVSEKGLMWHRVMT